MEIGIVKVKLRDALIYKYNPFEFCCSKLKNNSHFRLDDRCMYDGNDEPAFCLSISEDDGFSLPETINYPISFCPFCGKPIKVYMEKEVDHSNEFNLINKELERLENARRRAENPKKSKDFYERSKKLNSLVNEFLMFGEYDENMFDLTNLGLNE